MPLFTLKKINLILIATGIAGIILFYSFFPAIHPNSIVTVHQPRETIAHKADSIIKSWNFYSGELYYNIQLESESKVLDSLIKKWGRDDFRSLMQNNKNSPVDILYHWETFLYTENEDGRESVATVRSNLEGEIISIELNNDFIRNQKPVNRAAIRYILRENKIQMSPQVQDSLITALLDFQQIDNGRNTDPQTMKAIQKLRMLSGAESGSSYSYDNVWALTDFYLQQSVWRNFELQKDSVEVIREDGYQLVRTFLSSRIENAGLEINISTDVLPAGALAAMHVEVHPRVSEREDFTSGVMTLLISLIFFLWLLVILYLRIKAKAIDTKPAIVVAVITGFIAPAFLGLFLFKEAAVYISAFSFGEIFNILILLAIFGAISAVSFFILTAVSDSVTRQYHPDKLRTWDFIRSGIFNNKPLGWVIINGFSLGGIMAGIWILIPLIFRSTFISTEISLYTDIFYFAPLANIISTLFTVLLIVLIVFMTAGNQLWGITGKKWVVPVLSSIIFGLLSILPLDLEPFIADLAVNIIIGFVLGYIYLRYDFLTTTLAAFFFVNVLVISQNLIIGNSPDAVLMYYFAGVAVTLVAAAGYLTVKGTEREELPEYVPEYIEEQAMEQRIRQELNIARVVQHTFLPSQIKRLPGIDIAGTCIPALETGGDYYDVIPLGEARTAIAIGDVSGKGIRATFYMTFVKGVLHSLGPLILSPVELLNQLNRLFNENATRGTFISMIYGILEADKRQFTFARAGHNPMLVVRKDGKSEWIQPSGIGIGVTKEDSFFNNLQESVLKIKEGDVVVLYTDGITEMMNTGKRLYGEERLEKLVRQIRNDSAAQIQDKIIEDVNLFKGLEKQHDDMTLVIIKADATVSSNGTD